MFSILFQQLLIIFLSAGISLIVIGLGWFFLHKAGVAFSSFGEKAFFCSGTGFAVISYAVFFLGIFQILSSPSLYILILILAVISLSGWLKLLFHLSMPGTRPPQTIWDKIAILLLIVSLTAGLLLVLTPETGKDALIYHLAVPKLFLKHRGFYFMEGNIFSNYPLMSEMIFLVGLFLNGDVLAKALHFVFLLMVLIGIYQFARQRMAGRTLPILCIIIFYTIPSVFITSTMAYNDLFVTYYSMAAVFAFINWFDRGEEGWLILCGASSGMAIACKYTALLLPFLGCLGILWASRRHNTEPVKAIRKMIPYLAAVFILGSPFYAKNWIMTGNPFYPFLYEIFGGKGWEPEQARMYDLLVYGLGMGRELIDYILLPWNVSLHAKMNSPQFDGILGPIFLLTLPFAFGIRKMDISLKIFMVYCGFTFIFWAGSAQQIRYLIPIFPFLAILTGFILSHYRKNTIVISLLIAITTGCLAFNAYHISNYILKVRPIGVVIGSEDRDAFLSRMLPSYNMYRFASINLPEDSKIFLIYMKNLGFLCEPDFYSDSMHESYTIEKILSRSPTPVAVHKELKKRGFTHIMYDINYIYGYQSTFSPEDKSLFYTFQKEYLTLVKNEGAFFLYSIR